MNTNPKTGKIENWSIRSIVSVMRLQYKQGFVIVVFLLWLLPNILLGAETVNSLFQQAQVAYTRKQYPQALNQLTQISRMIRAVYTQQLEGCFPIPLAGWSQIGRDPRLAEEPMVAEDVQEGLLLNRQYQNADQFIDITVMIDHPSILQYRELINNPQRLSQMINARKTILKGKYPCVTRFNAEGATGEINVLVNSNILVNIQGSEIKNEAVLTAYAQAVRYEYLSGK